MHWTYVGGIERGERNPSWENVVKLATALDVGVSELAARAEAVSDYVSHNVLVGATSGRPETIETNRRLGCSVCPGVRSDGAPAGPAR